jgi:hypothetical protein
MAKKTAAKKKIELRHITDPCHGWIEVPETLSKSLGLGIDYPSRDGMLYMEEDAEWLALEDALKAAGYKPSYVEMYVDDFDVWLDGGDWPAIPATTKPYRVAMTADQFAERYARLCNYLEAMWANRQSRKFWEVDEDCDALCVVSPQSRAVAMHICAEILGIDCEGGE